MTSGMGSGGALQWLLAVCTAVPCLLLGLPVPTPAPVTAITAGLQDPDPPAEQEPPVDTPPVDAPPVDAPPVDGRPDDVPPVDAPPVDLP